MADKAAKKLAAKLEAMGVPKDQVDDVAQEAAEHVGRGGTAALDQVEAWAAENLPPS